MKDLTEHFIAGECVYDGCSSKVQRDLVRLPDGSQGTPRSTSATRGPWRSCRSFDDGRVLLERQFRYPHRRVFIELPAGKLEPGEPHLDTAKRELLEETATARRSGLGSEPSIPPLPIPTRRSSCFSAKKLKNEGKIRLDAGEFVETIAVGSTRRSKWCRDGRINGRQVGRRLLWMKVFLTV